MFISREYDYAVRIIRQLADKKKKTAEDISNKEKISYQFAYKILKKLEKGGLVRAFRGVSGGYALAKGLNDFSLYDVFSLVGEPVVLTACLQDGYSCPMNLNGAYCSVHQEFLRLQAVVDAGLKEKTMAQVLGL